MTTEVDNPTEETTTIKALVPVEQQIEKLNPVRAEIAELKTKLMAMTIGGIEDKAGYKAVEEQRKLVKRKRIDTGKLTDELIVPGKEYIEKIKTVGKFIETELREMENHLDKESDAYEALVKAEKDRKEQEEKKMVDDRFAILVALNLQYTGNQFIIEDLFITNDEIAEFKDEEFNAFISKVKPISERIAADKIEADRLKQEEADRLEKQRIDQAAAQKKIDDENEKIRLQNEAIENEKLALKKMKLDARVATLSSMGMKNNGTSSDHPSCSMNHAILLEMPDEEFEQCVRLLKEKIVDHDRIKEEERVIREELEAKKDRYMARRSQLMAIGLLECTDRSSGVVTFEVSFDNKDEEGDVGTSFEFILEFVMLEEISDEDFEHILIQAREANQKVVTLNNDYSKILDDRKQEAKRKLEAELAPDKEKLQKLADDIRSFAENNMPEFKHGAAKVIGTGIKTRLYAMAREIEESNQQF